MWYEDWLLSVPLLFLTTLLHTYAMLIIRESAIAFGRRRDAAGHGRFVLVIGGSVVCIAVVHGFEAAIWAAVYVQIGALPGAGPAMLYSLSAMTTYGHAAIYLEPHWQMMGAIEALNGVMLFGLTTATLLAIIEALPVRSGRARASRE